MFLQGKKAIVTGASRGIGRAIALRLAAAGADLACVSRSLDSLKETVHAAEALGRQVHAFAVDVSDAKAVEHMVAEVEKKFENVDILVNNAGVTRDGLLMRKSSEDWDAVLNTNLKGAFNFTKPVSRIMMRQRAGKIINIASIIGLIGNAGQANYAASKAGLIGFTKSIACEFASRSINCNVVCPGFIETDMTKVLKDELKAELLKRIPLARFGQADDIAGVVEFLCSPAASYMTGQILTVDGGLVI